MNRREESRAEKYSIGDEESEYDAWTNMAYDRAGYRHGNKATLEETS